MQEIIALQRWLYGGMASGLGDVAHGGGAAIAGGHPPPSCSAPSTR